MLAKASESDVSGFQAFTVRNLDNKLSTDTDIEQYKLLTARTARIACSDRHTYIHTYIQTDTRDNCCNPRCASAPRVN